MAITKIQSESLNLADTYAFTGTVTGAGGVNTPSFFAYLGTADQSISDNTWTKVAVNNEVVDTGNMYDTSTYRFTPTEAGTYYVYGAIFALQNNMYAAGCAIYKNGSFYTLGRDNVYSNTRAEVTCTASGHVVMNGSTDYVELYGHVDVTSGTPKFGGNDGTFDWGYQSYFGAYKIIE